MIDNSLSTTTSIDAIDAPEKRSHDNYSPGEKRKHQYIKYL